MTSTKIPGTSAGEGESETGCGDASFNHFSTTAPVVRRRFSVSFFCFFVSYICCFNFILYLLLLLLLFLIIVIIIFSIFLTVFFVFVFGFGFGSGFFFLFVFLSF